MAKFSLLTVITIMGVVSISSAQYQWGRCKVESTLDDFSLDKFQGVWYEVAYTNNVPAVAGARCQFAEYSVASMNRVYFKLGYVYEDGNANMTSITEGYLNVDEEDPTIWTYKESQFQRGMKYWIIDTDYHTFAIVHSCENRFLFWREEFTWVISRSRALNSDALVHVQRRFILSGLDGSALVLTNQELCTHPEPENPDEPDEGDDDGRTEIMPTRE